MTIGFKTEISGKPTYFIEKIWEGFPDKDIDLYELIAIDYNIRFGKPWDGIDFIHHNPKLHTIREDKNNNWKAGNLIHAVINNRTSGRFQFVPDMRCVSVQQIEINWISLQNNYRVVVVKIDGKQIGLEEIQKLALNDGFNSAEDFFAYFNKDFTGKIIHWTDLRY